MNILKLFFALLILFISHITYADNTHNSLRLFDTGEPIELSLEVGKEVRFDFEKTIDSVAILSNIKQKTISQSIDSRWWLKPLSVFEKTKILVKNTDGKIIVFVINAKTKLNDKVSVYKVASEQLSKNQTIKTSTQKTTALNLVDLTRFASQFLYAPKRLVKDIGLYRVPITNNNNINLFVCGHLFKCQDITSIPLVSWSNDAYYITAVQITNLSNHTIDLDPRLVKGQFIAATFQFNTIGVKDSNTDTSVLYLISKKPFEQSL